MNSKPRLSFDVDNKAWFCYQLVVDGDLGSGFQRHELLGWGETPKEAFEHYCQDAGICLTKDIEMTDAEKRTQAMYHLEVCFEPKDANGTPKPKAWIDAHITAAHYLIQSMFDGCKPDNYDEVMTEAAALDAIDETNCAIYLAKK